MLDLNFPNAIRLERELFGRENELEQIRRVFHSDQHVPVVILGERRIGKTSLFNVAVEQLRRTTDPFIIPLTVESRSLITLVDFIDAVLRRLSSILGTKSPHTLNEELLAYIQIDPISYFEETFARLAGAPLNVCFLLCIDEFELIVRNFSSEEMASLTSLLHHLIERTALPLRLIFSTTYPTEIPQGIDISWLISKSLPIELAPLNPIELEALLRGISKGQVRWTEEGLGLIWSLSGGHPYFAKLLLAQFVYEKDFPIVSDRPVVQRALTRALQDPRADHALEDIYRTRFSDPEKEVLINLARRDANLPLQHLDAAGTNWQYTAKKLVKRNFLQLSGDVLEFRIGIMKHWLLDWISFSEEVEHYRTLYTLLTEPVEIEIDDKANQVRCQNLILKLSPQEYRILYHLACRAGQLVEREELIDLVWTTEDGVNDQMLDAALYRLRKKMDDDGQYIETVPGRGFVLHRAKLITET